MDSLKIVLLMFMIFVNIIIIKLIEKLIEVMFCEKNDVINCLIK